MTDEGPDPMLTTEVVVACSYCGEHIVVPFRVGAVMPMWAAETGVRAYASTLEGGDHACQSERHRSERAHHQRWPPLSRQLLGEALAAREGKVEQ